MQLFHRTGTHLRPTRERDLFGQLTLRWVRTRPSCPAPTPGYARHCARLADRALRKLRRRRPNRPGAAVRIALRPHQEEVFRDRASGILILHWARQIGKSFVLAAWAVDRLLTRPGRLVTVLSNSRENGAEFVAKCAEVCRLNGTEYESVDQSQGVRFQNMRMEVRIHAQGRTGRIKVLAANPRTARGFSGDLILDEFAYHEDSAAIWEAAEPILASNADFLCRIASTGNGRHNLFYRMTEAGFEEGVPPPAATQAARPAPDPSVAPEPSKGAAPVNGGSFIHRSRAGFAVSRVTRTQACELGVKIYDPNTRAAITPEQARAQALDKSAYDQNYECSFADENLTLLSHELITAAERQDVGIICEQDWSGGALAALRGETGQRFRVTGPLFAGFDVARRGDYSVITVLEETQGFKLVRAILRMRDLRLPEQQARLGEICRLPRFRRAAIDMTGLGLGLFEYAQRAFGGHKIAGINFGGSVPVTQAVAAEGRKRESVRVTEALAMELLEAYEQRRIQHPAEARLRDDLRKPERITTPGGRVSIAATRDEAGHADHFWSLALALEACATAPPPGHMTVIKRERTGLIM